MEMFSLFDTWQKNEILIFSSKSHTSYFRKLICFPVKSTINVKNLWDSFQIENVRVIRLIGYSHGSPLRLLSIKNLYRYFSYKQVGSFIRSDIILRNPNITLLDFCDLKYKITDIYEHLLHLILNSILNLISLSKSLVVIPVVSPDSLIRPCVCTINKFEFLQCTLKLFARVSNYVLQIYETVNSHSSFNVMTVETKIS